MDYSAILFFVENVEDPYDTDEMSDYIPETDSESDASRESKGESHAGESEEKPHSSNLNNVLSNTSTNHSVYINKMYCLVLLFLADFSYAKEKP